MMTWNPVVLNLVYAAIGGVLMLIGGWIGHRMFTWVVGFDVNAELKNGNVAVGLALMGIFIATGIGGGLVIGLALN